MSEFFVCLFLFCFFRWKSRLIGLGQIGLGCGLPWRHYLLQCSQRVARDIRENLRATHRVFVFMAMSRHALALTVFAGVVSNGTPQTVKEGHRVGGDSSSQTFNTTALDCGMRHILLQRATDLLPWRSTHRDIFDALELESLCGDSPVKTGDSNAVSNLGKEGNGFVLSKESSTSARDDVWYVDPGTNGSDEIGDGTVAQPFATVEAALAASRATRHTANLGEAASSPQTIVLRAGVHFLNATIVLGPDDSGTTITAAEGEEAWLSGGLLIPVGAPWERVNNAGISTPSVWALDIPLVSDVTGLFSVSAPTEAILPTASERIQSEEQPHSRFTRARFPNGDAETTQWGYASVGRYNFSLPGASVTEWHKPPAGAPSPSIVFVDLSVRQIVFIRCYVLHLYACVYVCAYIYFKWHVRLW